MNKSFNVNDHLLSCEVELVKKDNFNMIIETLERMGMVSESTNTLFQSCHILQKKGKFYIVHFKEMFALDGKESTMNWGDLAIRNLIARILENWNLIKIKNKDNGEPVAKNEKIKIIPHNERKKWNLKSKYLFCCYRGKNNGNHE